MLKWRCECVPCHSGTDEDPGGDGDSDDDEAHRLQLGGQLSPISGVTVDGRFRVLLPATGKTADSDIFIQLHIWQ